MACSPGTLIEGSTPIIEFTFRDADDALEDPTSITAIHKKPDGSEVTYLDSGAEIAQESLGVWRLTLPAVAKGNHVVHVIGVGTTATSSNTTRFKVRADGVATV